MKISRIALPIIVLISFGLFSLSAYGIENGVEVIHEDDGIETRISVPEFKAEDITGPDGADYQKITIDGYGATTEEGNAQLPVKRIMLKLPQDVSPEDVTLEIVSVEKDFRPNYNVYPAPRFIFSEENGLRIATGEEFYKDKDAYSKDISYPDKVAEISKEGTGFLRGTAIVSVIFYPLSFNPSRGEIEYRKNIRLNIRYNRSAAKAGVSSASLQAESPKTAEGLSRVTRTPDPFADIINSVAANTDAAQEGRSVLSESTVDRYSRLAVNNMTQGIAGEPQPAGQRLKISIKEEGVYRITYNDFAGGLNIPTLNPRFLKMTYKGNDIPIYVRGEDDGVFNEDDYVEFYGFPVERNEYTETNVFFLEEGIGDGLRMAEIDGGLAGSYEQPSDFKTTAHFEENTVFGQFAVRCGEPSDTWFWSYQHNNPYLFTLNNISGEEHGDAVLRLRLLGYNALGPGSSIFAVYVNNHMLFSDTRVGLIELTLEFPQSYLTEGANELKIEKLGGDVLLLNWFEIEYYQRYIALDDQIKFGVGSWQALPQEERIRIDGFATGDASIYKITPSDGVSRVVNNQIGENNSVIFKISNPGAGDKYMALTESRKKPPLKIELAQPASLRSTENSAEWIAIVYDDFYDEVIPLAEHRASQGLRTKVVKVSEIYNEFSGGISTPYAIKDFLTYAYFNWQAPRPLYVVLIGDASMDNKDYYGYGSRNYVPTAILNDSYLGNIGASDNWFAAVDGDDVLPDMFIGRLTARNSNDVAGQVNKIIRYENGVSPTEWHKRILLVADRAEYFGAGSTFGGALDMACEEHIPSDFTVDRQYMEQGATKNSLIASLNQGAVLSFYHGHGHLNGWVNGALLGSSDIPSLNNAEGLPFVTSASCLTAMFSDAMPQMPYCFAEEMTRYPDKGAIAFLGYSVMDWMGNGPKLVEELFKAVIDEGFRTTGASAITAEISGYTRYGLLEASLKFLILFGDPAVKFKVPEYIAPEARIMSITPSPAEEGTPITFKGYAIHVVIDEYEWSSDRDGKLSAEKQFTTTLLSCGRHTISFRVKDSMGNWLEPDTRELEIVPFNNPPLAVIDSISPNPVRSHEPFYLCGHGVDTDGQIIKEEWKSSFGQLLYGDDGAWHLSNPYDRIIRVTITYKVVDNGGKSAEVSADLEVWPDNFPPILDPLQSPMDVHTLNTLEFQLTAHDDPRDNDAIDHYEIEYIVVVEPPDWIPIFNISNGAGDVTLAAGTTVIKPRFPPIDIPQGVQFDPETGIFRWTPAEEQGGGEVSGPRSHVFSFRAIDARGAASAWVDVTIKVLNNYAPELTLDVKVNDREPYYIEPKLIDPVVTNGESIIGFSSYDRGAIEFFEFFPQTRNILLYYGQELKVGCLGTDRDGDVPLTYSCSYRYPPEGVNFDENTGVMTWKPIKTTAPFTGQINVVRPITFSFGVKDARHEPCKNPVPVSVILRENTPPTIAISPQGDKAVKEFETMEFDVRVEESDEAQAAQLSHSQLPNGATLTVIEKADPNQKWQTAHFEWEPRAFQAGDYTITFSATDGIDIVSENIKIKVTPVPELDSKFISHTIPESIAIDEKKDFNITFRNVGRKTWEKNGPERFYLSLSIERLGEDVRGNARSMDGKSRKFLPGHDVVQPGDVNTFVLNTHRGIFRRFFNRPGRYMLTARMGIKYVENNKEAEVDEEDGERPGPGIICAEFGDTVTAEIEVGDRVENGRFHTIN